MRLVHALGWLVCASSSAAAGASDVAANAVYDRMIEAHRALRTDELETVYAPGASYLSRNGTFDIHGREQILRGTRRFHDQLRAGGGSITIRIRVVDRKRYGDLFVDTGYVRTTYVLKSDAPGTTTTGKFVTVLARQVGGDWAIVTDADADAPAAAFDAATAISGLKFDP